MSSGYIIEFSYNIHSKRSYGTNWQCTVRPNGNTGNASVVERNREYQAGSLLGAEGRMHIRWISSG